MKRVKSGRTGRVGWRFRFTDPVTGNRSHRTFWYLDKQKAQDRFKQFMDERQARKDGLRSYPGWHMSYVDFVAKFIDEALISSERRRKRLKQVLERNELELQVVSDFTELGQMTAQCQKVEKTRGDVYVRQTLQPALKQLTSWAASIGLLPHSPLANWRKIPRRTEPKRRRAFLPDQVNAILAAADERDAMFGRKYRTAVVFKALLLAGNRPGAVLASKVGDLTEDRIVLPPGNGKKRNGLAFLPPVFVRELRQHLLIRGSPGVNEPLFVSPEGKPADRDNLRDEFVACMLLAFVRMCWEAGDPLAQEVEPVEVAGLIYSGRVRGFDGAPAKDPKKIAWRERHVQAIEELTAKLKPQVDRLHEGRDMYALRKTHISWAMRLADPLSVKVQVGHAPQDVTERFYDDPALVDPMQSAQAVWDVLTGEALLARDRRGARQLRLAVGAEGMTDPGAPNGLMCPEIAPEVDPKADHTDGTGSSDPSRENRPKSQVHAHPRDRRGATRGIRTHDLRFTKCHKQHTYMSADARPCSQALPPCGITAIRVFAHVRGRPAVDAFRGLQNGLHDLACST